MSMKLFIFGVGYSGFAIAQEALKLGWQVAGTARSSEKASVLQSAGIVPYALEDGAFPPEIMSELSSTTHLVVTVGPGADDPFLARGKETILSAMPALRWVGYLSTVGVYGDHNGEWVGEEAICSPVSERSRKRLEVEQEWLAVGNERNVPVSILRLSGIYGPRRNALTNLERGTARRIIKEGQIFNRIHVEDIAGATLLLAQKELGGVFNVTDDEPAPAQDVVTFAASLMGVEPPAEIAFEEADMTPMARSFYGENKRVSNAKLKAAGYDFRFPNYRMAFTHLWQSAAWRDNPVL